MCSRTSRTWRRGVVALFTAYTLLNTYFVLTPLLGAAPPWAYGLVPLLLGGFSLGHAIYLLGFRHALTFLGISSLVSLGFEAVGVATGAIYGPYHYTARLGPQLWGVPLVVPISWFMVIYPAYILANYLADGTVIARAGGGSLGRRMGLSALSATLMTAWDVPLDPQMVMYGHWVWHVEGDFFGIPVQNYAGWLVTTMAIYTIYRQIEARRPPRPLGNVPSGFARMPIYVYALLAGGYVLGYVLLRRPALALVAFFAMGTPCLVAWLRAESPSA